MSLRQNIRFVQRALHACWVADTATTSTAAGGLLMSCHDVDRSMRTASGLRFSPLLEGVRQLAQQPGEPLHQLTHPWALFASRRVLGGALTINRRMMAIRLRALARPGQGDRAALEIGAYRQVLRTVKPRFIFSIQPPSGLCTAAREAGIEIAEVMHGTHVSLTDRIFCSHMQRPTHQMPTMVLSFDDVTQHTVQTLAASRDVRAVRAADPWLLACRRGSGPQQPLPGRLDRRLLLTLQWGYDGERPALSGIIPDGVLHPAVEQAISECGANGWQVLVRLHPIQMNATGYRHHRQRIYALQRRMAHVEFEQATAWPLPLLLDQVAAHITMSSSSVGEAAAAGVRSLALCPTLREGGAHYGLFRELAAQGMVDYGRLDAGAIMKWLSTCQAPPPRSDADDHLAFEAERALYRRLTGRSANAAKLNP